MIKVALIIERADTELGGAERSIAQLAAALAKKGADVTILAAKANTDSPNVKQLCSDITSKRIPLSVFANKLKQHLQQNSYDIIHSTLPLDFADIYQPRGGSYIEAMLRNADSWPKPIVARFKKLTHFTNFRRAGLIKAEKTLCLNCPTITIAALSEYVRQQFLTHYNIDSKRVVTIANGIAINDPTLQTASGIRDKFPSDAKILLFAANNFRLKGLTPLIKTLAAIDKTPPVCLVVAGSDKPDKYRRLAESLNIAERITFAGKVSEITAAITESDTVILPTYYDPCSRFILEGLAAAKPVITTKFNGAAEIFTDRTHGRIIDHPDDITSLTEAIIFCTDPDNADNISKAIVEDNLKDNISIDRHVQQLMELYEQIIKDRR